MNESEEAEMNESMGKRRIAVYVRIASTSQKDGEEARMHQENQLRAFINEHADWELEAIYADVGFHAAAERPGLNKLLQGCDDNRYDIVLMMSASRLARKQNHFIEIARQIAHSGTKIVLLKEQCILDAEAIEADYRLLCALERGACHA